MWELWGIVFITILLFPALTILFFLLFFASKHRFAISKILKSSFFYLILLKMFFLHSLDIHFIFFLWYMLEKILTSPGRHSVSQTFPNDFNHQKSNTEKSLTINTTYIIHSLFSYCSPSSYILVTTTTTKKISFFLIKLVE